MKYLVKPKNMKIFTSSPGPCCPTFCWGKLCSNAKAEPC